MRIGLKILNQEQLKKLMCFFYRLPNIILVITIGSELHCILQTKAEVRPEKFNFTTFSEGNYLWTQHFEYWVQSQITRVMNKGLLFNFMVPIKSITTALLLCKKWKYTVKLCLLNGDFELDKIHRNCSYKIKDLTPWWNHSSKTIAILLDDNFIRW